jgi:cell division septation protein DedD
MQDLSQYAKRTHVEIHSKYFSFIVIVSIALVGLVFALGVLVGSRHAGKGTCPEQDALAVLDKRSKEPSPPETVEKANLSFHNTLVKSPSKVPTPASLYTAQDAPAAEAASDEKASDKTRAIRPRMAEPPILESVPHDEPGIYSLQVGSFKDKREANEMVRKLERAGYPVFLVSVDMPERDGLWFRVRVGPFHSKREAQDRQRAFEKKEQLPAYIVKKIRKKEKQSG